MKRIITLALLIAVPVSPALAQTNFGFVITPGYGPLQWTPNAGYHHDEASGISFLGPFTTDEPFNLGSADAPFHLVYADKFMSRGKAGITKDLTLPGGCVLHIQGGIITGVSSSAVTNSVVNNGGC